MVSRTQAIAAELETKLQFERLAWAAGKERVAGLDEVGRGPLAGPVVAACVLVKRDLFFAQVPAYFYEIDDSKKLTAAKRMKLDGLLRQQEGLTISLGIVEPSIIDEINILEATRLAMRRAIEQLPVRPDHLLVDGNAALLGVPISQTLLVQGDSRSFTIGAASIVAKVYRDTLMENLDREYPHYGFAKHKGYGTREHRERLKQHGPCILHRRSFAPVMAELTR